ncbi:fructosamine kinase family protein [Mucilaginibacter myungsuensis]|uniref:Fructosamine kinase family protein n=1 Tax=Mucilaginibacter myungsuensis TaxID=649104 RepID=A0A929KUB6_9SPHI|nr:fructosamine kinase family protein [Mucilaginibacter myungsuensis]MBE9660553.1 fructosamine kinase family protein [Mucilaginibacter myungsuensis]MDN3600598.1 fructosamine kinase family protein [Mucilaginibacter myungsuensis]
MISPALTDHIATTTERITIIKPVSGGSINQAYYLATLSGEYFIKFNSANRFPLMFQREQEGLSAIASTNMIAVPQVIAAGELEDDAFLLMEWIPAGISNKKSQTTFGEQLAQMHRHSSSSFGFDADNYMGSLPQSNKRHTNWSDFFRDERLTPMLNIANRKGYLTFNDNHNVEQIYKKLGEIFPEEPPALIHGDLWSGNYIISKSGKPYLIDPAVSYGHREFDIAMTTLSGGFDRAFYEAYHATYPLQPGWQERLELYNLYPLLLHLNLFGAGYLGQVRQAIATYI